MKFQWKWKQGEFSILYDPRSEKIRYLYLLIVDLKLCKLSLNFERYLKQKLLMIVGSTGHDFLLTYNLLWIFSVSLTL